MPNPLKLYENYVAKESTSKQSGTPVFQWTNFGTAKFNDIVYNHDVIVDSDGNIRKRFYDIAQSVYGNNHQIGPEELEQTLAPETKLFILGTGQHDIARITPEGKTYLKQHKIRFHEMPSKEAIKLYNDTVTQTRKKSKVTIMLHVTC